MTIQPSEFIAGVTHNDTAQTITIDVTVAPWSTLFSALPALTATNSEIYDAAFLMSLESALNGKDALIHSPVGRGSVPTIQKSFVTRTEGGVSEVQTRYQLAACVYLKDVSLSPSNAVNNDD